MRKYRRFRAVTVRIVVPLVAVAAVFFGISWLAEFRPAPVEEVYRCQQPDSLPDTLTLVSWNIGYAGLGDNMDFFYDGGRRVRDTRARTAANLAQIVLTLQKIDADIMLLQEVDRSSHRTYRIDEAGLIVPLSRVMRRRSASIIRRGSYRFRYAIRSDVWPADC